MADSKIIIPSDMEDTECVKRVLRLMAQSLDEIEQRVEGKTTNEKQGKVENLDLDVKDIKIVASKINEILEILRKSSIISG